MLNEQREIQWWELVRLAADPSRLPRFPTEVCERILDQCDVSHWIFEQGRRRTFAACCLICRAWLPRSRYHLFKRVVVWSKEHVKQVSKMLHSIPALRTRVEQLDVCGSNDGKRDASWFGLVGFYLGPKLKALTTIFIWNVDFSLMKLDAYTLWGAFNRAWSPHAMRMLHLQRCTVAHLNQLIRLALVTKAEDLHLSPILLSEQTKSAPPVPVLPSGISFPLSEFFVDVSTSDLAFPTPWHTLAKQCPSLSSVEIRCQDENLDLSSSDGQLFLVSILCMFNRIQRHNHTNSIRLQAASLPTIEMRTRPCGISANADDTPLATRPRLRRELVVDDSYSSQHPQAMESSVTLLTSLEEAMALANYTDRRFHSIEVSSNAGINDLQPDSFQPLDRFLSRLSVATHDVHVIIEDEDLFHEECVVSWARERFPMLTAVVPNAFCDLEAGQPCNSHHIQANGVDQGQKIEEAESSLLSSGEATAGEATGVEQDVGIEAVSASGKRKATEGLEAEEEKDHGKRRKMK